MAPFTCIGKTGRTFIIAMLFPLVLAYAVSAASGPVPVDVVVRDAQTNGYLDNARIYLDGGYSGTTSAGDGAGAVVLQDVSPGTHTVRVTRPGYQESTGTFVYPAETNVEVMIRKGSLVSLNPDGPSPGGIAIVFYPSSTSYNCADHASVPAPLYMTNETRFKEDAENLIRHTYLNLDQVTSPSIPLPDGYQGLFNFYYYYDPSAPADAFSGCAGSVPERYWDEVTFADVTVILYPTYHGLYADSSCQPTGCYQNFGPARSLMKAPADQPALFRHETGHAVFGLIDTYCGATYYYQNDPFPNVWASPGSCEIDARSGNRDPGQCRQIEKISSSSSCIKNYWQWDPMPDIMANGYGGKFGAAATTRIRHVLSQAGVPGS